MRRNVGLVLVALGALLFVLAPMLRFYAYPRVAVIGDLATEDGTPVPEACQTKGGATEVDKGEILISCSVSAGSNVEILDLEAIVSGSSNVTRTTDISSVRKVVPNVEEGTDEVAVWATGVNTTDAEGETVSAYEELVAFDRSTSQAVPGFNQYYWPSDERIDKKSLDHEGYYFKLPFNTQQQDYDYWDSSLQQTRPMVFDGEDEIDGMAVYRFVQEIEPSDIDDVSAPGSLFGLDEPSVEADRMYANTRTIWVEPNTGVVIRGQEEQDAYLEYEDQKGPVVTKGTIAFTDEQVAANVEQYTSKASALNLVRNVIPIWGGLAGVVLLVVGALMMRRPHQPRRAKKTVTESSDGEFDDLRDEVR